MKKKMAYLVTMLFALSGAANASNLIDNPGFESGSLSPWLNTNHFCGSSCTDWNVTNSDSHSGTFSAITDDNIEIFQNLTATPTNLITSVSYWIKQPDGGGVSYMELIFSDSTSASTTFGIGADWTFIDATSLLKPGVDLVGFGLYGVTNHSAPLRTYLDDVVISVVPEPETYAMLLAGLGLLGFMKLRRRDSAV